MHRISIRLFIKGPLRPFRNVVDKLVAQVSKPAVSQSFQPADAATFRTRLNFQRRADLEFGDIGGLETCATFTRSEFGRQGSAPIQPRDIDIAKGGLAQEDFDE